MNYLNYEVESERVVEVNWSVRWEVYQRLQQLDIPCQCKIGQPLIVKTNTLIEAIQIWSVVQQLTAPRRYLVEWLERCFHGKWPIDNYKSSQQ